MSERRETVLIGWAAFGAFLSVSFQVAAKTARDTLFLSNFPVIDLPLMVVTSAVFSLVLAFGVSRVLSAYGPARVTPALFALSGVLLWGEWLMTEHSARLVAIVLYFHPSGLGFALVSAFWSLVGEQLDPHRARRFLPRIASAGLWVVPSAHWLLFTWLASPQTTCLSCPGLPTSDAPQSVIRWRGESLVPQPKRRLSCASLRWMLFAACLTHGSWQPLCCLPR
ncbi:MAG: hypothetical protein ACE15E_01135 [Acidobacteriota bacterium]